MNKAKAFIYYISRGNPQVFGIMLISAFFVAIARILAPVELNWDASVQLEAAHRFIKGLGLTSTFFPPPYAPIDIPADINQIPAAQSLTWWPPGYSLIVAGFLVLGIPLATTLKILYSITHFIGWFGWGIIASYCLVKPIRIRDKTIPAQLALAAILPLFYTPSWKGTDLFLWASIPFFILLFFNAKNNSLLKNLVAAGLLFGFLVALRYSTLFIAVTAFFILFQVNFPRIKTFIKSLSIFLASSLVFIISLSIYNKIAGSNKPAASLYNKPVESGTIPGLPEFVHFSGAANLLDIVGTILKSSSTTISSNLTGLPVDNWLAPLNNFPVFSYLFGAFCLVLVFALPFLVATRNKRIDTDEFKQNLSLSIATLPASLMVLLLASNFAQDYDFVGTSRYYIPVLLPALFIIYEFATLPLRSAYKVIKVAALGLICLFISFNLIYRPVFVQGRIPKLTEIVLGSYLRYKHNYQYPSNQVITLYDETSSKVRELQKENPDTMFFVQDYVFYTYDGHEGLRTLPVSEFWDRAYVSKAVKVFWVMSRGKCPGICPDHGTKPITRLASIPGLKVIYEAPHEKSKILVSDLPAGYKF